jgi:hypothetical protein
MAIAPIDLQTLFTQVDKVGKAQISQREGQALQQSIQGVQLQRKIEERIQEVNEAQDTGEGAQKVNDHHREQSDGENRKKGKDQNEEPEDEQASVFKDPSLGRTIDISF